MEWQSDYIQYDGNKIHYFHGGNKKPIILLHGVTDNGLCFSPVAQKLSESYHTIMPDARGHGLTEISQNYFSYDVMAKDIAKLIQDLKLEKLQIIGHSMGAAITASVASKYPELVSRIIIEDPDIRIKKPNKIIKLFGKLLFKIVLSLSFRGSYEKILKKGRKKKPTWSEEELQPWAESKVLFKQKKSKIFMGLIDDTTDWKEVISNITCPILLITSEKGMVKDDKAREIVDLSKDCKWIKIIDAGHTIHREKFERYMEEVQAFLL